MPDTLPAGFRSTRVGLALLAVVVLILFSVLVGPATGLEVPAFKGYVNDYADMIPPGTRAKLEQALRSFEDSDSTQVTILTIPSLEGDSLEDFSIRTASAWHVGQKGKDNGVLLLVARQDRKIRLEVGRGLEGVLTDLESGRIIDMVITPLFKDGRMAEGFEAGTAAIIQACRGEFKANQVRVKKGPRQEPPPFFSYLFISFIIISFLGRASKPLGMAAGAFLLPVIIFMGLPVAFSMLFLLLLVPLGAFGGLMLPILFASSLHNRSGIYMGGGYRGGSFSSGGFGGFGGGGFGGGGASGGW